MIAQLACLRRPALAALVCGCSASATFVTVPMSPVAVPADASALADQGADASARTVFRPLPSEPTPPSPRLRCRREVSCKPEEGAAPPVSFPPPFERCGAENGDGSFSPRETRDARRGDGHACCYVAFADCRT